jgi:RNA polymerase sigma-70 factor (ECF subfamily)
MNEIEALYKKYAPDVFRFAFYLSGERSDAEDITSETFVRVWASPETIRASTVRAYLFTIARNLFLQDQRRSTRHVALETHVPESRASPYDEIEQQSELAAVLARLQQLPEVDRAALVMRTNDGLSYEDISQALQISVASARVKVHRARRALADLRDGSQRKSP